MSIKVTFENNENIIKAQADGNVRRALKAVGIEAVALIQGGMETLYGKPIRDTGKLMGSIDSQVAEDEKTVYVGTAVEYAAHVHDGTSKMRGRPFIRDSLMEGAAQARLKQIAEA